MPLRLGVKKEERNIPAAHCQAISNLFMVSSPWEVYPIDNRSYWEIGSIQFLIQPQVFYGHVLGNRFTRIARITSKSDISHQS